MNWVGGARSRVKAKDTLKKQREFFEKRRFQNFMSGANHTPDSNDATGTAASDTAGNNMQRTDLSKDVIFLRTLMKETAKPANNNTRQVVHVNMERVRPCRTPPDTNRSIPTASHVELPESPEIDCPMTLFYPSKRSEVSVVNVAEEMHPTHIFETPQAQIVPSNFAWNPPPAITTTPINFVSTPSTVTPRPISRYSPKTEELNQTRSLQSDTDSESIGDDDPGTEYRSSACEMSSFHAASAAKSPIDRYRLGINEDDDDDDPTAIKPYTTPGNLCYKFAPISKSQIDLADAETQTYIKTYETSTQTD